MPDRIASAPALQKSPVTRLASSGRATRGFMAIAQYARHALTGSAP